MRHEIGTPSLSDKNARLWMRKGLVEVSSPSVNYVTAVSDKYFWILLSGESDAAMDVSVRLGSVADMVVPGSAVIHTEAGKTRKVSVQDGCAVVELPAKGFRAVAFPLPKTKAAASVPALSKGMKVLDGGATFGKIFIFRIRSPFGWDSVYGFAETAPLKGKKLSVKVECNGKPAEISDYPFEWSFYRLGMDEKASLKIVLSEEGREDTVREVTMDCR